MIPNARFLVLLKMIQQKLVINAQLIASRVLELMTQNAQVAMKIHFYIIILAYYLVQLNFLDNYLIEYAINVI